MIKLFKTISFCTISWEINQRNVHCFTRVLYANLAEVFADRQQFVHRLPSDYQQGGSNLPSISSCASPHDRRNDSTQARWQYDISLPVKSTRYGRRWHVLVRDGHRWHVLVRDGHRSTADLLSFSGSTARKLRPLRATGWCFTMTSACKYLQLARAKFWAC